MYNPLSHVAVYHVQPLKSSRRYIMYNPLGPVGGIS